MRVCQWRQLGRIGYGEALRIQRELVEKRKQGAIPDQLLLLEHPHVITLGRNGRLENLLATPAALERAGIEFFHTDRGGDITYHGPGQVVGYPILDLRGWRKDVVAYVRGLEQVIILALERFGLRGEREAGRTGVWIGGRKIAAIGVHVSRWVTSHGFAFNVSTDLSYFRYIVPCGLSAPVTSMWELGVRAGSEQVHVALVEAFARVFECEMISPVIPVEQAR
ncbi:MAG: lipoyl(octanoyl) transferase LipB [Bryobacterales bacterium]|nr:lipoyl(octanoyl) transferase LipB [Bryobacteraceae bacterium]MDW8131087.1 lipoyl(octanoyl) transferase LipB [Bryobacterales bacterium]